MAGMVAVMRGAGAVLAGGARWLVLGVFVVLVTAVLVVQVAALRHRSD